MKLTTRDITEIGIMTALISVTAWISIPIGVVPITLQTLMVMIIGLFLTPRNAFITILSYLIIGAIGIPVFSGGTSGFAVLFGPTGGFLFAFLISATFVSKSKSIILINNQILNTFIWLLIANAIIYAIGWTYYGVYNNSGIGPTLAILVLFIPGDLGKIFLATYAYSFIYERISFQYS